MVKSYGESIVDKYSESDASGRVDIICNYYEVFLGIIESSVDGLVFVIEDEQINNRRAEKLALGVRVQTSGHSDPTGDTVTGRDEIRRAVVTCDFSGGVLNGCNRKTEYVNEAYLLDAMRRHYYLFRGQLGRLSDREKSYFIPYLEGNKGYVDMADELGVSVETAVQMVHRTKMKIKGKMVNYLEGKIA
ncbi:MAG: hypothetical protein J6O61_13835 [Butyrivibrio sp.]|uniref:hypothetical protein n=1 Tax=Butyrivibrio sp. TaxID=28121 RepID=UPI001B2F3185|nr:hypothetical protein [Butyrivibrio sp.]MBO6241900.1 hypothetical protein [Butyrivibrio sp.]